jgi:N-acetylmuramoyl-L-alanine amidase
MRLLFIILLCSLQVSAQNPVAGKRIVLDPGHGGTAATDNYRVGKKGEREEWINLRVALFLKELLLQRGAIVFLTRTGDQRVELSTRAQLARDSAADLFISIHHNATADNSVNFPIIYFHGAASENKAGVQFGTCVTRSFINHLYRRRSPASLVSDYTIFPEKGAGVLRETYGIPGLLCEASFFTNEKEEERLKTESHNKIEALAYVEAIECFFRQAPDPILPKKIPLELPPFSVLQEAGRMQPEAMLWLSDFQQGKKLMRRSDTASLKRAYDLFTRSARSFPDSWVARDCHLHRSEILRRLHLQIEAKREAMRAKEFYVR